MTATTELLKGTLEGLVLGIVAEQPTYGYDVTARLRELGLSDLAEGTVYALLIRLEQRGLVDVERVPSTLGPPRKVYSLNDAGRAQRAEFAAAWRSLDALVRPLLPTA